MHLVHVAISCTVPMVHYWVLIHSETYVFQGLCKKTSGTKKDSPRSHLPGSSGGFLDATLGRPVPEAHISLEQQQDGPRPEHGQTYP